MKALKQYPAAEVERMMKLQDVLLKAMAKKITWWEAAEIIGVSDRTMRRWRERLEEEGYSGLADRRKGKPSDKRVPLATAEKVLRLFQESYYDLNIRHFHEKLREEHAPALEALIGQPLCKELGWLRGENGGASTAGGESGGRCQACCCTLTAANTNGLGTSGGMI